MQRTFLFAFILACLAACGDDSGVGADAGQPDAFVSAERPSKRHDIVGVADPGTNTMAIFGGDEGPIVNQIPSSAYNAETWLFDPVTGWTDVTSAGPSARGRGTAANDPNAGRMLVFGGRWRQPMTSGNYELYNDLWSFSFADKTWTQLDDGTGTAPAPRYIPVSVYDGSSDTFYVFGGALNANPLSFNKATDLWAYDSNGWRLIPTTGMAPSSRVFMGVTHDTKRNRLIVFGGQVGDFQSLAFNDLYALDLGTYAWTQLDTGTGPSTRMHPPLTYDEEEDRYILFGGHTDIGDGNDLWEFDPEAGAWTIINQADTFTGSGLGCLGNSQEVPANYVTQDLSAPERRHRGLFAKLGGDLWIFGGMHAECSDQLDDTWKYDLGTGLWNEIIEARSGESCARRNDACECLCF